MSAMAEDHRFDDDAVDEIPTRSASLVVGLAGTLLLLIVLMAGALATVGTARAATTAPVGDAAQSNPLQA
jgi:hypothetical protein